MEYISKQSLLADLNEATPRSYFAFETMVRVYPTEDVAPVVHAHWEPSILPILQVDWFRCSLCKKDAIQTPFDIPARTEYCPYCGARMDEEV